MVTAKAPRHLCSLCRSLDGAIRAGRRFRSPARGSLFAFSAKSQTSRALNGRPGIEVALRAWPGSA